MYTHCTDAVGFRAECLGDYGRDKDRCPGKVSQEKASGGGLGGVWSGKKEAGTNAAEN